MPEMLPDRNIGQRRFTIEIGEISLFSTFFIIIINYHHSQVLHYLPKNKYSHFSRDTTFIRRCLCLETCRMIVLILNVARGDEQTQCYMNVSNFLKLVPKMKIYNYVHIYSDICRY